MEIFGSIQEDRQKVEQFHFLWNSSTFYGTVSQFVEQRSKILDQLLLYGYIVVVRNTSSSSCN